MATIELTLTTAILLYDVAKKMSAEDGELRAAYKELENQLGKVCETVTNWTQGNSGNFYISGPGWKVSYKIANDTGEPETALLDRDSHTYYVLAGDHRQAYFDAKGKGIDGLKLVFNGLRPSFKHFTDTDK